MRVKTAVEGRLTRTHWDEILRLATLIRQCTVTASLMLRKLGSGLNLRAPLVAECDDVAQGSVIDVYKRQVHTLVALDDAIEQDSLFCNRLCANLDRVEPLSAPDLLINEESLLWSGGCLLYTSRCV